MEPVSIPAAPVGKPRGPRPCIVLFDGICNLCTSSVLFILKRDPHAHFRFASIQSAAGRELLQLCGFPPDYKESILYVEGRQAYTRSDAALRIVRKLRRPWPLLYLARIIPAPIRDGLYDWVARHRYSIFGRRASCMVPTAGIAARFL